MKVASEILFNGSFAVSQTYDKTKVTIPSFRMKQYNLGANAWDKFAGPMMPTIARVQEQSGVSGAFPFVIPISSTMDWVFLADNSTAGATRNIVLYTFDKVNHQYAYIGKVALSAPGATNATIRGLRVIRRVYTTGTVQAQSGVQAAGIAWTRSGTTATVTQAGHGLSTGMSVRVSVTSDASAIPLNAYTITVLDANRYTFTCLNAGGASGTVTLGLAGAGVGEVVGATWSRSTTTATITSAAHGLTTGQTIYNSVTSDAAAIVLGQVTVTVVDANTFTFTCLNAGAASGTITYVPTGSVVTGVSTAFVTDRLQAGARIGFGSTDPTQISTWYDIAPAVAIPSDTKLNLTQNVLPIAAGTSYVIEELMVIASQTNATATNGGLVVLKGISFNTFTPAGLTVTLGTTIDNIRATYWLKDAATETNTTAAGVTIDLSTATNTNLDVYVLDGAATSLKIYRYNVRALLTSLSSGASVAAFVYATGAAAVVGNIGQNNNGRISTLHHGPAAEVKCLFMYTASRIYRIPVSAITNGSTVFPLDSMTENPPGGTSTYALGTINGVDISETLDRVVVLTPTPRNYFTKYYTDGSQFDNIFGMDTRQLDQGTADVNSVAVFQAAAAAPVNSAYTESGFLHIIRNTTSSTTNIMYAIPVAADWQYAAYTGDRLITPEIPLSSVKKLYRALINNVRRVGSLTLAVETMPFRTYYRTSGIDDNSGAWTLLNDDLDLSGAGAPSSIQFMFEFKVLGVTLLPARLLGMAVLYESDDSLPPELAWDLQDSSNSDGTVGFVQESMWSVVPTLTITYRRVDNDSVVLVQASSGSTYGFFEYWTGSAWQIGFGGNSIGQRRRFRPTAGLPTGVDVYAKIVAS